MTLSFQPWRALLVAALVVMPALVNAQTKPRIEKAADLPRFSYKIDGALEDLVRHAERFAPFAAALRRDVESVIAGYEIPDKATQRELLTTLAVLDYLEGRFERAFARAEEVRALQEKPADRLISGLGLRAVSRAALSAAPGSEEFKRAVADYVTRELAAMPFATVQNEVRELKASAELAGEGRVLGNLREVLQPIVAANGALSSEFAPNLVFARYTLTVNVPLKQTFIASLGAYLDANKLAKSDIWAARDAALPAGKGFAPVRLAVWDSGVDTQLFGKQVLRDARGQPLLVAFDKYSRPAKGELTEIPAALRGKLPEMKARTKGLSDLQSNIDSPEASEVKRFLSQLPPEQYKPAIEELGLAGNYSHGTHVAGIAMAGNPHARLIVARLEFNHRLQPDPCPSREQALRDAAAMHSYVAYMKKQRAQVVNMSWGGSVNSIETELEQCGVGATPEARKALARELFEIGKRALTDAMARAPQILFVAAAGNSANDASFVEDIPAGIVLPNLLTVGAVDLAGDEAGFTSYGPTVKVHANGYQVLSYLPGGEKVALSGTSMASPQVAGLAAKLLAVNPKLKPEAVIKIIVDTGERSADGRRNLMHPKKALEAARATR